MRDQKNSDLKTIQAFGQEWSHFNHNNFDKSELTRIFNLYFKIFPEQFFHNGVGADIGCGSGRWATIVAQKAKKLYCIDASPEALTVARSNLTTFSNIEFINASVDNIPIEDDSLDFAYSLGVLHHIPDTAAGIRSCVKKLKKNAPLLVYLYYAFDNKPCWFRWIWKASDQLRLLISKLPFMIKLPITQVIAIGIYFPLARFSLILEKIGVDVKNIPLSSYRHRSFYVMRTDALDRFGTRLEQRFTAKEIIAMLEAAGLTQIKVNQEMPYWCAIGYKN